MPRLMRSEIIRTMNAQTLQKLCLKLNTPSYIYFITCIRLNGYN